MKKNTDAKGGVRRLLSLWMEISWSCPSIQPTHHRASCRHFASCSVIHMPALSLTRNLSFWRCNSSMCFMCLLFWNNMKKLRELWHLRLFYTSPHTIIPRLYVSGCDSISEPQHFTTTVTRSSPTVALVEFSSSPKLKNDVPEEDPKTPENEMSGKVELVLSQKVN